MSNVATAEQLDEQAQRLEQHEEDSSIAREKVAADLREFRAQFALHEQADRDRHADVMRYKAQIRVAVLIALGLIGYAMASARWTIKHAMRDVLIEEGIIEVRRVQ